MGGLGVLGRIGFFDSDVVGGEDELFVEVVSFGFDLREEERGFAGPQFFWQAVRKGHATLSDLSVASGHIINAYELNNKTYNCTTAQFQ